MREQIWEIRKRMLSHPIPGKNWRTWNSEVKSEGGQRRCLVCPHDTIPHQSGNDRDEKYATKHKDP